MIKQNENMKELRLEFSDSEIITLKDSPAIIDVLFNQMKEKDVETVRKIYDVYGLFDEVIDAVNNDIYVDGVAPGWRCNVEAYVNDDGRVEILNLLIKQFLGE